MSTMSTEHNLPADLRDLQVEIEAHAKAYGLDFYDTIFEVLDYDELSEIAALGGFPTRYPHWSVRDAVRGAAPSSYSLRAVRRFTRWSSITTRVTPT